MIELIIGGKNMEVVIIIALFASTAFALNFLVSGKTKLAGMFNILNLCLTVAAAYQFKVMKSIAYIIAIAVVAIIVFFIIRYRMKHKVINAEMIEHEDE